MAKYKEVKGNLLDMAENQEFDIVIQGCNCFKMMGAGIAGQIAVRFPHVYDIDRMDMRTPTQRLGDFTHIWDDDCNCTFINLYSQYNGGRNLDYQALELGLRKVSMLFQGKKKIGLPLIGCGIAGGDWDKVRKIIKRVLSDFDVTIVIYEK